MLYIVRTVYLLVLASQAANAYNFPFESIQLNQSDIGSNKDLAFGNKASVSQNSSRCKTYAGDDNWPSSDRWNAFNESLGGALVKGIPPAAACYQGPYYDPAKCAVVQANYSSTLFVQEDPTIPSGQWQLGNPCPVPANISAPQYTCNVTAFPAYDVVVTTVKQIQLAVNFARNNNIRLTIKNTGHDFLGRSTGGGGLQIYLHKLKAFEYLPNYTLGKYTGKAARVGAALEQYDLHVYMPQYNITLLAPGSTTVGAYGGFFQGGGFSTMLTSKLGLMVDQVLSFEVVTANGSFVHADPSTNEDLYWAIRGGGPGNFGVVTSLIVKAYDTLPISQGLINFQTNPVLANDSSAPYNIQVSEEAFWKGIAVYFSWLPNITAHGGVGWNFINTIAPTATSNRTYQFVGQYNLGGYSSDAASKLIAPAIEDLQAAGINKTAPYIQYWETYSKQAYRASGPGEAIMTSRFGSRLFPRENFEDKTSAAFNASIASIRAFVEEGGYNFHSVDYTPTTQIAGWPGSDSAVSPYLRNAIVHATGYDSFPYGPDQSPAQQIANHARLNSYVQKWRDATPGSGAYMNEADTEEPNPQQSFFGDNYKRLLRIKNEQDPWRVFYAVTQVASDEWKVEGTQGLPTQQGRLCRV